MWLVAGLGNPGPTYSDTRHNAGYLIVELLAGASPWRAAHSWQWCSVRLADQPALLMKPETYMNLSGRAVRDVVTAQSIDPERLIVVHDDVDLPLGTLRLKRGGGHGGHRGIGSISAELGTNAYLRVRVGIGRPLDGEVTDHVLGAFDVAEAAELPRVLERGAAAVVAIVDLGLLSAANTFNVRPRPAPEEPASGSEGEP